MFLMRPAFRKAVIAGNERHGNALVAAMVLAPTGLPRRFAPCNDMVGMPMADSQ